MIKKNGGKPMAVSYDKLWVILNEREMMKTDLVEEQDQYQCNGEAWKERRCSCGCVS